MSILPDKRSYQAVSKMPKSDKNKSPYSRSESKYEKWRDQGRGTGSGPDYIPGLFITEVPSRRGNQKHSVPGIKSKLRLVQLMSKLELMVFLFFDLAKQVTDIREQYPLDRSITLALAEKLKLSHPSVTDAKTGNQIAHWMTTDLLIDYFDKQDNRQQLAVYIKLAEELKGANLDKLIIEYAFWALKGVRFCIVIDESIPKEVAENLGFVKSFYERESCIEELTKHHKKLENLLLQKIKTGYSEINALCKKLDIEEGLHAGCSLSIFYYMVASRKIDLPLARFSVGPNTHSSEIKKYLA